MSHIFADVKLFTRQHTSQSLESRRTMAPHALPGVGCQAGELGAQLPQPSGVILVILVIGSNGRGNFLLLEEIPAGNGLHLR